MDKRIGSLEVNELLLRRRLKPGPASEAVRGTRPPAWIKVCFEESTDGSAPDALVMTLPTLRSTRPRRPSSGAGKHSRPRVEAKLRPTLLLPTQKADGSPSRTPRSKSLKPGFGHQRPRSRPSTSPDRQRAQDRLALVAPIVVALGHEVIAREIDIDDVGPVTARETRGVQPRAQTQDVAAVSSPPRQPVHDAS